MTAADGKKYKTDCADTERVFRLIQSIPSPESEPFTLWGVSERFVQVRYLELSIDQANIGGRFRF
jgi:hypothetical protein